jgi:hypothetical protein
MTAATSAPRRPARAARHARHARVALLTGGVLTGALVAAGCSRPPPPAAAASAQPSQPALPAPPAGAAPSGGLSAAELAAIPGRLAFTSDRHGGQHDVFLLTPGAAGPEVRLTSGPEDEYPAAVLPGGAGLLVVSSRGEGMEHAERLWRVPLGGGPAVPLLSPRRRVRNPSLAAGGTLAVLEASGKGLSDLRGVPVAGGPEVLLADAPEGNFDPDVSPDGTRVAFVSSREGDPEVYVVGVDGKGLTRLTAFHREDVAPRWSPDGRHLVFVSNREGRDRLFVMRPDGTGQRALTGGAPTGEEGQAAWSPDGTRLAFVGRVPGGRARLWVVPLEGGAAVPLTDGKSGDEMPAWAPDGRTLAFTSDRTGKGDLYLVRADGTGLTRLTHAEGAADWLPRWVPGR